MRKLLPVSLLALLASYASATTTLVTTLDKTTPIEVNTEITSPHAIAADEDGWSDAVEGVMVDNILCTGFGMQSATYNVQVKKNFETNSYLILDPWRGLYDQIGGEGQTSPSMEIDASDPNNILIPNTEIGVNGGEGVGNYELLSMSYFYYMQSQPCPEESKITIADVGENTVITFPYRSMVLHASISGGYSYAGDDVSTITFPTIQQENSSIGDIIVDAEAEVEYYNLQGIRIDNPKSGQIVIKRQGNVVSKEFIR